MKILRKNIYRTKQIQILKIQISKENILFSVMLYKYGLSSYEILRKKFRKFGNIKHFLRDLNIKVRHADEMFIKAKGKIHYLHAVIDDKSQVIALHVSERRDMHSAVLCLRKAKYIGKAEILDDMPLKQNLNYSKRHN